MLKLHLRVLELHRKTLRLVSLRPQLGVRFSSNHYHDTWHILAGVDGGAVLARLLWGLAFQRQPGTMILIDGDHLVSTPFDGDAGDPILLIPEELTHVDVDDLRALVLRLRRAPPAPTTIRWDTHGMATAAEEPGHRSAWRRPRDPMWQRERMSRRAGYVCYTAPRAVLRARALEVAGMGSDGYLPLASDAHACGFHYDGEIQTVPGFAAKVEAARAARQQLHPEAHGLLAGSDAAYDVAVRADRELARRIRAGRRT